MSLSGGQRTPAHQRTFEHNAALSARLRETEGELRALRQSYEQATKAIAELQRANVDLHERLRRTENEREELRSNALARAISYLEGHDAEARTGLLSYVLRCWPPEERERLGRKLLGMSMLGMSMEESK